MTPIHQLPEFTQTEFEQLSAVKPLPAPNNAEPHHLIGNAIAMLEHTNSNKKAINTLKKALKELGKDYDKPSDWSPQ